MDVDTYERQSKGNAAVGVGMEPLIDNADDVPEKPKPPPIAGGKRPADDDEDDDDESGPDIKKLKLGGKEKEKNVPLLPKGTPLDNLLFKGAAGANPRIQTRSGSKLLSDNTRKLLVRYLEREL